MRRCACTAALTRLATRAFVMGALALGLGCGDDASTGSTGFFRPVVGYDFNVESVFTDGGSILVRGWLTDFSREARGELPGLVTFVERVRHVQFTMDPGLELSGTRDASKRVLGTYPGYAEAVEAGAFPTGLPREHPLFDDWLAGTYGSEYDEAEPADSVGFGINRFAQAPDAVVVTYYQCRRVGREFPPVLSAPRPEVRAYRCSADGCTNLRWHLDDGQLVVSPGSAAWPELDFRDALEAECEGVPLRPLEELADFGPCDYVAMLRGEYASPPGSP